MAKMSKARIGEEKRKKRSRSGDIILLVIQTHNPMTKEGRNGLV